MLISSRGGEHLVEDFAWVPMGIYALGMEITNELYIGVCVEIREAFLVVVWVLPLLFPI